MIKTIIRTILVLILAAMMSVPAFAQETVIGNLDMAPKPMNTEHPWYAQCQLGSVCADAFRTCAGTDIALVNTGDLDANLFQGEVTKQEICDVLPYDRQLAVASVTPRQLWQILEQSVSGVVLDLSTERVDEAASQYGGFCQISGITLKYDASAPLGERVLEAALSDGTALSPEDDETLLTLCASGFMLEGGYGFKELAAEPLDYTQTEALAGYISAHTNLPEDTQKRIDVVGAREAEVLGIASKETVLVCIILLCVPLVSIRMKMDRYRDEYGNVPDKYHF